MPAFSVSRRRLFLHSSRLSSTATRPPGAQQEAQFLDLCTRCGDCIRACPTQIIVSADGGYPSLNFTAGQCTFCLRCVHSCTANALQPSLVGAWQLQAMIGPTCLTSNGVECRICGEACEAQAIRFPPTAGGVAHPYFDAGQCSGCGACIAPCPTQAISMEAHHAHC